MPQKTKSVVPAEKRGVRVQIGVNTANAVIYLADSYGSPKKAIGELVQNALDSGATKIHILVDGARSSLRCLDNGEGTTKEEALERWENVGTSSKQGDDKKTGRKGTGRLAILGFSDRYVFTTRPVGIPKSPFFTIELTKQELKSSNREGREPAVNLIEREPEFRLADQSGFTPTGCVLAQGVTKTAMRELLDFEGLTSKLAEDWGIRLKEQKVELLLIEIDGKNIVRRVPVKCVEFSGEKQDLHREVTIYGEVVFELWTTLVPVRNPQITVIHKRTYQFSIRNIPELWRQIKDTLGSGHYQGYIYLNFGEPSNRREGLEHDTHEDTFVETVVQFVDEFIKPNLEDLRIDQRFSRYQGAIQKAVDRVTAHLKSNPALKLVGRLRDLIGDERKTDGLEKSKRKPVSIRESREKRKPPEKPLGKSGNGEKIPNNSTGKPQKAPSKKTHRVEVKTLAGLTVALEEAESFSWRTKIRGSEIVFNISHPDWVRYDSKGQEALERYIQFHLIKEMAAEASDQSQFGEIFRTVFDTQFVTLFRAFD